MLSGRERYMGLYEFSVRLKGHKSSIAPMGINDWNIFVQNINKKKLDHKAISSDIQNKNLKISLDDIKFYDKYNVVCLLFTVVDKDAADTVYRNLLSSLDRVIEKGPDEGGAASAHLVIDLNVPTNEYRYRAGLEQVEGVTQSRIMPFLEQQIRLILGKVSGYVNGKNESGDAKLELQSLHEDFISDAAGRPVTIELIQLQENNYLDQNGDEPYIEKSRTITYTINRKKSKLDAFKSMFAIREKQKQTLSNHSKMRIRFAHPNNKTQTEVIDDLETDLKQVALTKRYLLSGFTPHLKTATIKIRDDLVEKMIASLRSKTVGKPS